MNIENKPDFKALAKTAIEIFHPEVMNYPDDVIEMAIAYKALKLEMSYETMLAVRRHQ